MAYYSPAVINGGFEHSLEISLNLIKKQHIHTPDIQWNTVEKKTDIDLFSNLHFKRAFTALPNAIFRSVFI